jgi:hypothetical protein
MQRSRSHQLAQALLAIDQQLDQAQRMLQRPFHQRALQESHLRERQDSGIAAYSARFENSKPS